MPRSLDRYDEDYWAGAKGRRAMLMDCARALDEVVAPSRVIDIGSGPGWMLEWWDKNKPEVRTIGYDKLAFRLRRVVKPELPVPVYPTDINLWRIEPLHGQYDLAICVNVHADIAERDYDILVRGLMALAPTVFFAPSSPKWEKLFLMAERYLPSAKLLKRWREALTVKGYTGHTIREKAQIFVRPRA